MIWNDETEGGDARHQSRCMEIVDLQARQGQRVQQHHQYTHSSDLKTMQELFGVAATPPASSRTPPTHGPGGPVRPGRPAQCRREFDPRAGCRRMPRVRFPGNLPPASLTRPCTPSPRGRLIGLPRELRIAPRKVDEPRNVDLQVEKSDLGKSKLGLDANTGGPRPSDLI